MKRIIIIGSALVLALGAHYEASAQAQMTAVDLASRHNASGSARYQALSGAMGAVGTDFSSVHQNPAGIALFRSGNKLSLTGSLHAINGTSTWGTDVHKTKTMPFRFDELSYMTSWQSGGMNFTAGFGIQNNGRLQRGVDAAIALSGRGGFSLADYTAALLNGGRNFVMPSAIAKNGFDSGAPWLGVIGYNNGWVDYNSTGNGYESAFAFTENGQTLNEGPRSASLIIDEKGHITNYDFALGVQFSPAFSLGFSVSAVNLDQEYRSWYTEGFRPRTSQGDTYGLSLDNSYRIQGYGARVGMGILVEPIEQLRLGASIHTPTFYSLTIDTHSALSTGISPSLSTKGAIETRTPIGVATSFGLHTPWRFGLSGAYIFDRTAILSLDYEYANIGGTRLRETTADSYYHSTDVYAADNDAIRSDFGGQHTLRAGLELNATRRLALRAGYRYTSKPGYASGVDQDVPDLEAYTAGTVVHYRLPGVLNSFSLGMGYRLSPSWTLDVAYTHMSQTDRVLAFPFIKDIRIKHDVKPITAIKDLQARHQLSATISYRF